MKPKNNKFKLATSIWILSCTDKIPQMMYKSMTLRLESYSIEDINNVVTDFPELFQIHIPIKHFNRWKEEMKKGQSRPKWIAQSKDQEKVIDDLEISDTFRNRFRNSFDSPPVNPEILKWGLDYINDYYSINEKKTDKIWSRLGSVVLPLFSVFVAGFAIYLTQSSQSNQLEFEAKKAERELLIPSYHKFLNGLNNSLQTLGKDDYMDKSTSNISDSRTAIFELDAFMPDSITELANIKLSNYQIKLLQTFHKDSIPKKQMTEVVESFKEVQNIVVKSITKKLGNE